MHFLFGITKSVIKIMEQNRFTYLKYPTINYRWSDHILCQTKRHVLICKLIF